MISSEKNIGDKNLKHDKKTIITNKVQKINLFIFYPSFLFP